MTLGARPDAVPGRLIGSREAEAREIRDREILALLDHAERLEARAADLRAQARSRLAHA